MKQIEIEGKTVTMAVEKGLSELGLRRDQVEVAVLQEANPGFLGLGAKSARVRLTEKLWGDEGAAGRPEAASGASHAEGAKTLQREAARPPRAQKPGRLVGPDEGRPPQRSAPHDGRRSPSHRRPEPSRGYAGKPPQQEAPADPAKATAEAEALVAELFDALDFSRTKVAGEWDAAQMRVKVEVETADEEWVVGKEGTTLESLQFLTTLMLSRRLKTPVAVQVETAGFWRQKEESILAQVYQAIDEVRRTGKLVRLQPMEASLRRMVHRTLAQSPDVETVSEGEGVWRKIVLKPKRR